MGWTSPRVVGLIGTGVLLLTLFAVVEARTADPMFDLGLFRVKAFAAGAFSSLLAAVARGGMQFMLIIWLQGIWLPLHGYNLHRHNRCGPGSSSCADGRFPGIRSGEWAPIRSVRCQGFRQRGVWASLR